MKVCVCAKNEYMCDKIRLKMAKGCCTRLQSTEALRHAFSRRAILYARWICIARLLLPK